MDKMEELDRVNDGWCLFHTQKKHSIFIFILHGIVGLSYYL